jgi:site-specific recombinase XerD
MNLPAILAPRLPALIVAAGPQAAARTAEFFLGHITNGHTRKAYARAVGDFASWCETMGVTSIADVQPLHVSLFIRQRERERSAPTVKQALAAIRMLFDHLVISQVIPTNPAASVRGPKHVVKRGKTPVLTPEEARHLLDSIDAGSPAGLRDRALIGLMVYTFARISAAAAMNVSDVFWQGRRLWVRLHEKGGKDVALPCHHNLETYLEEYLANTGIGSDTSGPLFRTIGRGTGKLSRSSLPQSNAWSMINRRAKAAGIRTKIGNHTFRATGITAYLKNGGTLEKAAAIANHASTRTTQLYDRCSDDITLDEIERVII